MLALLLPLAVPAQACAAVPAQDHRPAPLASPRFGLDPLRAARPAQDEEDKQDAEREESRFQPWNKNYFLVVWNPDLSSLPSPAVDGDNLDLETNFQLSVRTRITDSLLLPGWKGHIGYTGTFFWQMFDSDDSSPFRTTDHAPELFGESSPIGNHWLLRFSPASHMSNGESGADSRSWNRTWAEVVWFTDYEALRVTGFERRDMSDLQGVQVALRVWEEWGVDDSNNPDIGEYYGHFELNVDWFTRGSGNSALSLMLRNNLREGSDNRSTVRLEWSFDVSEEIRLMLQFYTGYGLNLLDYDRHQQSVGFGLEISP